METMCYTVARMLKIGYIIAQVRKGKGMGQGELAIRASMSPAQLCLVEKDRVSPTIRTVERLAEALGISLTDLFSADSSSDAKSQREMIATLPGDYIALRRNEPAAAKTLSAIIKDEEELGNIEDERGISSACDIFPKFASARLEGKGAAIAGEVRKLLGTGLAPFGDLAATLDFRGVRIYKIPLQYQAQSVALWNKSRKSLSIILDERNTPERDLYRLAYELGSACIFIAEAFTPIEDTHAQHRFLSDFSAEFLMPAATVRQFVAETGISRTSWTLEAVCALKARFGASAEAFALRLEELGLIDPSLRIRIRDSLREHYAAHPACMEPAPSIPPLNISPRRALLAQTTSAAKQIFNHA